MSRKGTAVAHCPLSNAYFSSTEIFRLREALDRGVKVGLGSDIAGGYELGIQGVMRMSVAVSRLREGLLKRESQTSGDTAAKNLRIDWKESLYLATKGGAEAMGLPRGSGWFNIGAPFDAQQSRSFFHHFDSIIDTFGFLPYSTVVRPNDR
jgi:guanine deaminase